MEMRPEKLTGFILVGTGVAMILIAVISAFNVMVAAANPPELFKINSPSVNFSVPTQAGTATGSVAGLPGETVSRIVNTGFWLAMMAFLVSAGAKIANIGATMLRVVKVVVKNNDLSNTFQIEN